MPSGFLLYGSTGFVGDAMARLSVQRGLRPIVAGRNAARVESQAAEGVSSFLRRQEAGGSHPRRVCPDVYQRLGRGGRRPGAKSSIAAARPGGWGHLDFAGSVGNGAESSCWRSSARIPDTGVGLRPRFRPGVRGSHERRSQLKLERRIYDCFCKYPHAPPRSRL